jgi:hypothetical protein
MGEDNLGIELISRDGILNALIPIMSEYYVNFDAQSKIIDCVMNQKIAYDVKNVVAELACNSRFIDDINEHNIKCISCVIGQKKAIDIVKRGGVDERT